MRNLHKEKIAHDCVAYIEKIKDLLTGKEWELELVELKWAGVIDPRVSIPPRSFRRLDAFHISKFFTS